MSTDFKQSYAEFIELERQAHQGAAKPLRDDAKHFRIAPSPAYRPKYYGADCGDWVSIRVCDDDANSTRLGIYIGEIARGISAQYLNHDDGSKMIVVESAHHNPAIYVPSLKRVVFGAESWWCHIESPDKLREITDETIDGVWYVQALKALSDEKTTTDQPQS